MENRTKRRGLLAYAAVVVALYVWAGAAALPSAGRAKSWGYDLAPRGRGWYVAEVDPDGPAAAFLRPGDRVAAVDGDARVREGCVWAALDGVAPGAPYTLAVERDGAALEAPLVAALRTGDARSSDARLFFAVGVAFLLVGGFVAAFAKGSPAARLMCATWITLAFGLLSQTLALVRDFLDRPALAIGIAAFPALLAALCLGFAFAYRVPWDAPRSRFWTAAGRVLYAWGAAVAAALVYHSLARLSGQPVRGPLSAAYPAFFAATNFAYQSFVAAAGLAMCAVSVRNYARVRDAVRRRRVKWLVYGTVAAVAPFTAVQTLTALSPAAAAHPLAESLGWIATAALVLLPVFVGYGIATERLFDVEVVVRRAVQHVLARGLLETAVALQWIALAAHVVAHADLTIREVFARDAWLGVLLAVSALSLRYRKPLGEWIDRRFFREAWDRERTLRELVDELERVDSLGEGARLVLARLDATLHTRAARVFLRRASGEGFEVWSSGDADVSLPPGLPTEAEWTDHGGGRLLVPMLGAGRLPAGVLVLADKRSEQPYTATDRRLLLDVAARFAAVAERFRLAERVEIEQQIARDSLERERQAEEAERRARFENQAKSLFLASMSHELRTPLNAVLGFAQLMRRDASLSAENREHLEIIMRSGEHLLGLINDVLSISKIEAGKLTLAVHAFDLNRLLQAVEEMVRARAASKGVRFEIDRGPGLPAAVRGDDGKLRQVLVNLLGNAVKFTDSGHVVLRARWADGRARFEVEDTGRGIARDELSKLFVAFEQTEAGRRAQEGTGLGLVISREMVRLMGGDIAVASEPGRGSTFSFEIALPEAVVAGPAWGRRTAVGLAPGSPAPRVLVADGVEENRLLLAKLLRSVGLDVREAADGARALEVWESWRPQLVWMDQRMAVAGEIRRREAASGQWPVVSSPGNDRRDGSTSADDPKTDHWPLTTGHCRIIALTASAFEHERGRALAGGCDDFVTKPFREETIFEKMEQHLGLRFVYVEEKPASARPPALERVSVERLAAVPCEQMDALKRALTVGDVEEIRRVVAEIGRRDRELADGLAGAAEAYQYDALLDLADRVAS